MIFRIEIDASDNNNTTALHYAAKYVFRTTKQSNYTKLEMP